MSYELIYRVDLGSAQSPFRVVAQPTGREVGWINRFLDQCCVRGLAWHTLRGYAFALMQFVRWCLNASLPARISTSPTRPGIKFGFCASMITHVRVSIPRPPR